MNKYFVSLILLFFCLAMHAQKSEVSKKLIGTWVLTYFEEDGIKRDFKEKHKKISIKFQEDGTFKVVTEPHNAKVEEITEHWNYDKENKILKMSNKKRKDDFIDLIVKNLTAEELTLSPKGSKGIMCFER